MRARLTLLALTTVLLLAMTGSGVPAVPDGIPDRQDSSALTPERAKVALVALLRSDPNALGWVRITAEGLAAQPIKKDEEETYLCGCVTINPQKCWYAASSGGQCHAFASGKFELKNGRWVALRPEQVGIACHKGR